MSNERWIFFGDSLTDNGLFHDLSADFLTATVPFQTANSDYSVSFTNGQVYADTWMDLQRITGDAYINLALGGAQATGQKLVSNYISEYSNLKATNGETFSIVTDLTPVVDDPDSPFVGAEITDWNINLAGQIDRYLTYYDDDPEAFTTASIFIGANDLSRFEFDIFDYIFNDQVEEFAAELADAIEDAARALAADGVDRILLNTLPIAELFYSYDGQSSLAKAVARDLLDEVSSAIKARSAVLKADGIDTRVIRIDLISSEFAFDAKTYGFLTREPQLLGYGGDPDWVETSGGVYEPEFTLNPDRGDFAPDERLFYDEIHPSAALHDALAIFSYKSVTATNLFYDDNNNSGSGTAGDDFLLALAESDVFDLGDGNDTGIAGRGNDSIAGGAGFDLLIGGSGSDSLSGGTEADFLDGSSGADLIEGGAGGDLLLGGEGAAADWLAHVGDLALWQETLETEFAGVVDEAALWGLL